MAVAALLLLASFATALRSAPYLPIGVNEDITLSRLPTQYNPGPLTELKVTDNVINLKRADSWSMSSVYVQALRRQGGVSRATVRVFPNPTLPFWISVRRFWMSYVMGPSRTDSFCRMAPSISWAWMQVRSSSHL